MKHATPQSALESKVYTAIGRASMCWETLKDAGQFDEKQAREISAELCAWIIMNTNPKPRNVWERIWKYLKSTVRGLLVYLPHYFLCAFFIYSAFALILEGYFITYWQSFGVFWLVRICYVYLVNLKSDRHEVKSLNKADEIRKHIHKS